MKEPEPQPRDAMKELLGKLRIAQEDILHDVSGDIFAEGIVRARQRPGGEKQVERFRRAFEFARGAGRLSDELLFAGLREQGPVLVELKDVYPERDDATSRLDYLMFVASLIGGIPEDRFNERQLKGDLPAKENAAANLSLTEKLLKAAAGIPDTDLRALVTRTLLGGISFLELEQRGEEDGREPVSREEDAAELLEMAGRTGVPPALVSRALELAERQVAETLERRRRRKAGWRR